jgi:hypothetical protein
MSTLSTRQYLENRDYLMEHCTYDEIEAADEMIPYDLIHELLAEIRRLAFMVIDARRETNTHSKDGEIYNMPGENVFNAIYHDHPAINRYVRMFGDEALKPWEF